MYKRQPAYSSLEHLAYLSLAQLGTADNEQPVLPIATGIPVPKVVIHCDNLLLWVV